MSSKRTTLKLKSNCRLKLASEHFVVLFGMDYFLTFIALVDHRDMLLREQLERIRASEETNLDYENTIQQFRELVQHLQSDLEHLRSKQEQQQTENVNLSSQSQSMMSLNMQLQSTVMKAQAKAIDLELRKLEAAQANDRLSYIQVR